MFLKNRETRILISVYYKFQLSYSVFLLSSANHALQVQDLFQFMTDLDENGNATGLLVFQIQEHSQVFP